MIVAGEKGYETCEYESDTPSLFPELVTSGGLYLSDSGGWANHNKFFAFESLDLATVEPSRGAARFGDAPAAVTPALYVSSANLSTGDREKHNAGIVVSIDVLQLRHIKQQYSAIYDGHSFWRTLVEPLAQLDFWMLFALR